MQRINALLRTVGIVGVCGLAALALPRPAHAGGVHVSLGFGLPVPVYVAPGPGGGRPAAARLPRAARLWAPRARGRRTPPVVVQPPVVYGRPSSRGDASYGGSGRPWRHRHHADGTHDAHGYDRRTNAWHDWRRR